MTNLMPWIILAIMLVAASFFAHLIEGGKMELFNVSVNVERLL